MRVLTLCLTGSKGTVRVWRGSHRADDGHGGGDDLCKEHLSGFCVGDLYKERLSPEAVGVNERLVGWEKNDWRRQRKTWLWKKEKDREGHMEL